MTVRQLGARAKKNPLSKAQIDALRKLAADGPCQTSKNTEGVYIAGTAAAALERRGLIKRSSMKWGRVETGSDEYSLTNRGREALATIDHEESSQPPTRNHDR